MALSRTLAFVGLFVSVVAAAGTDSDQTSLIQIASGAKVGAGVGILSSSVLTQLSSGTGEGAGRSAMLQYGEDVVNLITKKYGAVPENISETDKQLLTDIIGIISTTMYDSMDTDHAADQTSVTNSRQHVVNCNAAKNTAVAGEVTTKRTATETARAAHIACRKTVSGSQQASCLDSFNKNKTLYDTLADIKPAPAAPGLPDKDAADAVDQFADFFASNNTYVYWFNHWSNRFLTDKNAADAAAQACDTQTGTCDSLQNGFENAYDQYKQLYDLTCSTLGTCWTNTNTEYDTLQTNLGSSVDNRKEAYVAGETIIHKIGCLLGDAAGCADRPIDDSKWNLTFPSAPAQESCDLGSVKHSEVQLEHCSTEFRKIEYLDNGLSGHAAVSDGIPCQ